MGKGSGGEGTFLGLSLYAGCLSDRAPQLLSKHGEGRLISRTSSLGKIQALRERINLSFPILPS